MTSKHHLDDLMIILRKLDVVKGLAPKSYNEVLKGMMTSITSQMYNTPITDLNGGSAMLGLLDQIDKREGK